MLYQAYEMARAMVMPYRALAIWGQQVLNNPYNPLGATPAGSALSAAYNLFEAATRRYDKPVWGLRNPEIAPNATARLTIKNVMSKPFCDLLHFKRSHKILTHRKDPKVLLVAPMSGHYATLLRGTVEALLPDHDVYITDWRDARMVPLMQGKFDLEDFISYVIDFIRHIGENVHVVAVCQPGPPVLAAISLMSEDNDPYVPATMTYMGSPIDPRESPTVPNELATNKSLEWFEQNVIDTVPFPYAGSMRRVYPGFLQLTGFMTMNLERHYKAHVELYHNLVKHDGDSVEKHRKFYDEYLSVMDLTAEFYLDTIRVVFQEAALPQGNMIWKNRKVNPAKITRTALMTIEGQLDDISGVGQTKVAHKLCKNIPENRRLEYLHPSVGHYGIFNGSKWKNEIKPTMAEFMRQNPVALPAHIANDK